MPRLTSREAYIDHLEGFTQPTVNELEQGKLTRKPVKTYMLETASHDHELPELKTIFPDRIRLNRLDDTLYRVEDKDHDDKVVGLLEALDERHPVFYTTLAVTESHKWVHNIVHTNPWLDRLWLSSPILYRLWQYVKLTTPAHRYVRLGFDHEAKYEASSDLDDLSRYDTNGHEDTLDEDILDATDEREQEPIGRRRSRVILTEQLAVLQEKLPQLLKLHDPLHSLVQLQIPGLDRGGHLLYYDGRATNRTSSFADHREMVRMVIGFYRRITEHTEKLLWLDTTKIDAEGFTITGAPVTIRLSTPLSKDTFDQFVRHGLQRRNSRFRINGYITLREPTKIHMAAIDRHLWQPFLLEMTSKQLLGVLPRGTCGNTIHRLVTNIQRYLDPNIDVWLGSENYKDAIENSMIEAA